VGISLDYPAKLTEKARANPFEGRIEAHLDPLAPVQDVGHLGSLDLTDDSGRLLDPNDPLPPAILRKERSRLEENHKESKKEQHPDDESLTANTRGREKPSKNLRKNHGESGIECQALKFIITAKGRISKHGLTL
jgi:hypothetical protein